MYKNVIKYFFDFLSSLIVLIILLPLFFVLCILLSFSFKSSPFFIQERIGYKEKKFKIIKFKTMNDKTDNDGKLLSDELRLTYIGKFVRNTSLDEIPQLFNVLFGNMSVVGPRPLLTSYMDLYNDEQRKRHFVKPGITGWTGVNGRNAISWKKKFELDVWYVEHQSFWLDMKILWLTVIKVVRSEGISAEGEATIKPFTGNE